MKKPNLLKKIQELESQLSSFKALLGEEEKPKPVTKRLKTRKKPVIATLKSNDTLPRYYTDGGTKNNGKFGFQESVICVTDSEGKVVVLDNVGDKTNNEAELLAILQCLKRTGEEPIKILCDSQLCVGFLAKGFSTKVDRLQKIIDEIAKQKPFCIEWIRRDYNLAGHTIESVYGL